MMKYKAIPAVLMAMAGFALGTALISRSALAVNPQPQAGAFATPLTAALIDDSASAEFVDGSERRLQTPAALRQLVWTRTAAPPGGAPLQFGSSPQPGPRYLRLGFTAQVPAGSVLVRGGDQLSVLRPGASYPGNLADDSQWLPAQRIAKHQLSTAEVDPGGYALWILPPGTKTRALRFTHVATQTDKNYAGILSGVYLLADRFENLGPDASVFTSANAGSAPLLVDEQYNDWHTWDNGPTFAHPVTRETPEWVTLVWPQPVSLRGLAALWAGFDAAEAQVYTGPAQSIPQAAPDTSWQSIGGSLALQNQYPHALGIDWVDFGKTVQTRAIRLRMTHITDEHHHQHLVGKTRNGNRIWLGELMAISPVESAALAAPTVAAVAAASGPTPPIPVHFTLDAPAFVTLVIDDAKGNRVRNLVSDTQFQAGPNTVWWDGTDDLGRTPDAAAHGVYLIPTHFVTPGQYTVRGLAHKAIDLHYEFSVYNAGTPAWETADGKGGWLTNHSPPLAALFMPADKAPGGKPLVYLGSYISEGGSGLAWVDLDGHKQGGRGWIGGTWTAAPYLARDIAPRVNSDNYLYAAAVWGDDRRTAAAAMNVNLLITALTSHGEKSILKYPFTCGPKRDPGETVGQSWAGQIGGLAVRDNVLVVSLKGTDRLIFVDAATGKTIGMAAVKDPRGIAFDAQGSLLVLSGTHLLRYASSGPSTWAQPQQLPQPQVLVSEGLEDPAGLTIDGDGTFYISDRGSSNQVKVFDTHGKLLRSIGRAGPSVAGPYDPLHMNSPRGMAIDSNNHLWVAEEEFQPKRVSLWTLDGKLLKAFYGPAEYGGGGVIDPQDKTRFYYHQMEFKLDWQTGTDTLTSVLYRPAKSDLQPPPYGQPVNVLYSNGHRYFTNSFLGHGTNGVSVGMLYLDTGGVLRPVAALGKANDWPILQGEPFKSLLPPGTDLTSRTPDKSTLFTWSDLNDDGKIEPNEVSFLKTYTGSITIASESGASGPVMLDALVDGKAMRYLPVKVTATGVPVYDLHHGEVAVEGAQAPAADGGGQMLYSPQAIVLTTAPQPFAHEGVGGVSSQGARWSYPSLWPGLHPSHSAPVPDRPGLLTGTTRLLGDFIQAPDTKVGRLWGINANFGAMYLFTADGLFVTQLFQDARVGKPWNMPTAQRGMLLNDVTSNEENFFPSLTQTADGKIYMVDGHRISIVRVDGLETVRRLPDSKLDLSTADLEKAHNYLKEREEARQGGTGAQSLQVEIRAGAAPALHDLATTLKSANWATVDHRITQVYWSQKPDVVEAAITIAAGRLYAAFRSNDPNLLRNSGAVQNAPFKTGGALDLMIGANPSANPARSSPVEGDIRLLVYQVNNQTHALLYRPVIPGTKAPMPFSSPDRTITIDQVLDVSDRVQLDTTNGVYAFSIPLETLGLKPKAGETIKADIGILRGNGGKTTQRAYWNNKATGVTSDVPSEAELTPALWGYWTFK